MQTYRLYGFTVKISSRGDRHLIYVKKRNNNTDGLGPFNIHRPNILNWYPWSKIPNLHTEIVFFLSAIWSRYGV